MPKINAERLIARMKGDFVVFLIGMRINKFWKVNKWLPVAMAMPKMIKEFSQKPESGFLGLKSWFGKNTIMLQYWESFEKLEAYGREGDTNNEQVRQGSLML